jgi:hypothetical protein
MMRNFGSQVAKRELGEHWVDRFVQRYPNELVSKWMMGIDNSRHKADSGRKYSLYFNLYERRLGSIMLSLVTHTIWMRRLYAWSCRPLKEDL